MEHIRKGCIVRGILLLACSVAMGCDDPLGRGDVTQPLPAPTLLRSPLASDAFNRADENPIAGSWSSGPGLGADLQLSNNAVKAVADPDPDGVAYWNALAWPANQWSEITIQTLPTGSGDAGPAVRIAATAPTYYAASVAPDGRVDIYRSINLTFTRLHEGTAGTVVAGDRVRLEADGTVLRVFRNDALVGEAVDNAIASGFAGMSQENTAAALDDWAGGALDSAPPPPPPSPPAAPTNLAAAAVSASQVNVSWTDNATDEAGFRIERCTGAGCSDFTEVATVGANVVSYPNTGLTASTSYSYRVRAHNGAGTSAYSNAATATTPTQQATDRVPDLGMDRLRDIRLESSGGRRRLRYSTTIVNVGSGPFELHGRRAGGDPVMSVVQRVFDDAGGWREITTPAVMELGGDGHDHWHVHDLELSELFRLDDGGFLARSDKRGFCFWDNVRYQLTLPGAPQSEVYHEPGCGDAGSTTTAMGLSIGWGDIYPYSLPDQFIDITGLADGRYRLVVTADASGWFAETSEDNNVTWVDLELYRNRTRIRVLGYGPNAMIASAQ